MKESDLYLPLREWLLDRGYEVHVEIFGCDVVAVKNGLLTAIELKLGLHQSLREQVANHVASFDFVYGAFPGKRGDKPKVAMWRYHGIGCLLIDVDCRRVHQALMPRQQPHHWRKRRNYRADVLSGRVPAMDHELAGLPACPALKRQRQLRTISTNLPGSVR